MKQEFLKKKGNPNLILFFSGWGSDDNLFRRMTAEGYDYMLCFDYNNLDFDYNLIKGYKKIIVLAWSMGVWVANNILSLEHIKDLYIDLSIAINGTIYPIDNKKGIPNNTFKSTLENFSEKTLVKFRRRICGNLENTKEFLSHSPYRGTDSLRDELEALWNIVLSTDNKETLNWDIALIGTSDKIFPFENQVTAWKEVKGCKLIEFESEHYNSTLFDDLLINLDKSKLLTDGTIHR